MKPKHQISYPNNPNLNQRTLPLSRKHEFPLEFGRQSGGRSSSETHPKELSRFTAALTFHKNPSSGRGARYVKRNRARSEESVDGILEGLQG